VRQPGGFDIAFQAAERERAEALIVLPGRFLFVHRQQIGDFAAKNRLIMVGASSFVTDIGGLLSYGPNVPELAYAGMSSAAHSGLVRLWLGEIAR
jgi:putative tryptophan/tyrosine transport system substrate-binding protein